MSTVRVREADTDDASRLAEVYRSAYAENRRLGFPASAGSVDAATVTEWVESCHVFVAVLDGTVVGGVRLEATAADRAKLSRLGVHEDWKGSGVGSRLLDHALSRLRAADYETVWLTTPPEHPYLPEVYRRRGFVETDTYPLPDREYDEVVMEREL
jgi:N-acetylglutamate synthase-like GNAT family acetyltransferase